MGYCTWAGMNEANQIYHDTECPCYQKIIAMQPTVRKRRDKEVG